jgi:hypothetical protein
LPLSTAAGTGSNAANARRPAKKPPICACHAIACSTPGIPIENTPKRILTPNQTSRKAITRGSRRLTESGAAGTRQASARSRHISSGPPR